MNDPKRVLIAEDDRSIATALEFLLRRAGYVTHTCHDGLAALDEARAWRPALIVLDVMLPRLSGLAVARALRTEGPATKLLMLTARGSQADREAARAEGADAYLVKPFATLELLGLVQGLTAD